MYIRTGTLYFKGMLEPLMVPEFTTDIEQAKTYDTATDAQQDFDTVVVILNDQIVWQFRLVVPEPLQLVNITGDDVDVLMNEAID